MAVNHQHLRAFHAVATEGSFSRAARRLNVSQPTLSQQIKALEARHGAHLFETRRVPLRLTPIGRDLFALTARLFATSQDIDALLGEKRLDAGQPVRIVADAPAHAARFVQALLAREAGLEVSVQAANAQMTLQILLDARADLAIASDPRIDPALIYKPLFTDTLVLAMARDHPLAGGGAVPVARLARECLLVREHGSRTRGAADALLSASEVRPTRTIELHSRELVLEAAAIGLGVGLVFASECPPDPRLAVVAPETRLPEAAISGYLVYAAERRRSALVQAALAAAEAIQQPPAALRTERPESFLIAS